MSDKHETLLLLVLCGGLVVIGMGRAVLAQVPAPIQGTVEVDELLKRAAQQERDLVLRQDGLLMVPAQQSEEAKRVAALELQVKILLQQHADGKAQLQALEQKQAQLTQRTPPINEKAEAKKRRQAFRDYCESQGLRFDRLEAKLPAQATQPVERTILCK